MAILLTAETMAWLEVMASNGLMVIDSQGRGDFSPKAKELISALHEVLSGGQVQVVVQVKGDPGKLDLLDSRLQRALSSVTASLATGPGSYSP